MKAAILKRLKEKGLKLTSQRKLIIDVLVDQTLVHPSAAFIYREARKKAKRLSLSTVYATLNELSKQGIIKMLEFDQAENRYEANMTEHVNLVCKNCKKILDYKPPFTLDTNKIFEQCHFQVTDNRLEYYGYCQECRAGKGIRGDA
jgi:Fe2+ or Zn2+ uptake regulation protein